MSYIWCLRHRSKDKCEDTKEEGTKIGSEEEEEKEGKEDGERIDYTLDMAHDFLLEQVKLATESSRPVRGPYLARLEMLSILKQRGYDAGNGINLLVEIYIK